MQTFSLPCLVPTVPPKNVTVTFVPTGNNLSCTFSWDPLPEDAVRGIIRGYKATYEPVDILYLSQCSPPCPPLRRTTINTTSTTITVHNCRWYTNYSFHVLAFTVEDGVSSPVLYQASPEGGRWIGLSLCSRLYVYKYSNFYYYTFFLKPSLIMIDQKLGENFRYLHF